LKEISLISKKCKTTIIAGSIPIYEKKSKKIYNSCFVFNENGEIISQFNKIHLFDIDIKDKITFKESDVLSPGNDLSIVTVKNIKIGIGI
jgi:omega-amidase